MNKKILIIGNGLSGGGIERHSIGLANYFASIGYSVYVLALYKSKHFFELDKRIKFYEPHFDRKLLNKYIYVAFLLPYIRNKTMQIKPDTVLAFNEWTNQYVILSLLGSNIPVFVAEMMNPDAKLPKLSTILRKHLYRFAKGVIAQTEYGKQKLNDTLGDINVIKINNPITPIQKLDCIKRNRIVCVGRLSPEKGHKYLIDAFAKLDRTDWELSIVGDGTERENLERLAIELGIERRVIFHGHLKDFSMQLSEAQVYVLPSLTEGFPNALIEAMSVPLACVSTAYLNGNNEIIEQGVNGLIVPTGNAMELADAINILIKDSGLREKIAKSAYRVREDYAFKKIAQQYLDFILPEK